MSSKKNSSKTGLSIVIVIAIIAIAYAVGNNRSSGSTPTEVLDDNALVQSELTTTAEGTYDEKTDTKKKSKSGKQRAKGIEIPAYLTDRDEEIVMHKWYTLSYNKKYLVPNWVAWVLTPTRVDGTVKRGDDFHPDTDIVHGPIAQLADYKGSGYDRGHMCPAADNKHSREAMYESFCLSNMCPQNRTNNAGDWDQLEKLCRQWAKAYDSIYIVCGPIIEKGVHYDTIGDNHVLVPKQFYKVVLRWVDDDTAEGIGFIMNNDDSNLPIASYAVTIDSVECRTGINFFSKLPKDVERRAEATMNVDNWLHLRQTK